MNKGNIGAGVMGGIGSLFSLGTAISQLIKGKKIQRKLDAQGRPIMTTPDAFNEYESMVRQKAIDPRMAGQTTMEQNVQANTANQLANIQQTAGNSNQALMAGLMANKLMNNNLTNIGLEATQQANANKSQLYGVLGQKANMEQQQWQHNTLNPYLEQAQQVQALKQAGLTNISNSLKDVGSLAYGLGNSNSDDSDDAATKANKEKAKMVKKALSKK